MTTYLRVGLPCSALEVGPVVLPLRGLGPDVVEEVRGLLLWVGRLQHHPVKTLYADGALVTMSQRL